MFDSVQPHRRQPTRLPRPWDSPGKNTGVGCHFLLQCMKVNSESEVAQSCPTPSDPLDCSPPGPSVHGIFKARVLEWGAIAFSGAYSWITCKHLPCQEPREMIYSSFHTCCFLVGLFILSLLYYNYWSFWRWQTQWWSMDSGFRQCSGFECPFAFCLLVGCTSY